ncbi:hypothetical protein [Pseudanabaena sp. PCC 6802]|uniref:hypothetical protein n=1 Tax=Pseudanabaena sp. PCC 6802 TaxID=118173 RepID=UPI000347EE0E|nr:hypothetical protein [Pseudanabaena sp. PCC 6802]
MKNLIATAALCVSISSVAIALPAEADVFIGGTVRLGDTGVVLQYGSIDPYRTNYYPAYSYPYTDYYGRHPYSNYGRRYPYTYYSYPAYRYPARVYAPRVYVAPYPTYVVPNYSRPSYYDRSLYDNYYRPGYYR